MRLRLLAVGTLLLLSAAAMTAGQDVNDLYQQGLARETAGDLKGAIEVFERVVRDASANRALTAKALVQLGRWSDLVEQDQSRKYYERVVREFADQKEAAADARARLDALGKVAALGATPARRLVVDWSTFPAENGAMTRDGRHLIVFNQKERAFQEVEVSTGNVRQLTSDGPNPAEASVRWAGWSAQLSTDGRRLAAPVGVGTLQTSLGQRPEPARLELRLFDVGGRGPGRTLTSWDGQTLGSFAARVFAWSPRDDRIWLFVFRRDQSAQIASVDLTGNLQVLKTLTWRDHSQLPSLSPDGKFIAYHDGGGRGNLPDIYLLAADGSREQRLEHPADDNKPVFTPDGSGVVFESNRRGGRDLWYQPVADGRASGPPRLVWRNLGAFGAAGGFSDAGSLHYFFATNEWGTYSVPIDLRASAPIGEPARVAPVNNESNSGATFSPDGRYLAHFRGNARLVIRELKSGNEKEIPFGVYLMAGYSHADWCTSGDTVVVTGYINGAGGSGEVVYRVNVKDATLERMTIGARLSLCVGDGSDIVYIPSAGRKGIVRRSLTSGAETVLFDNEIRSLARSQDGTRLAFVTPHPNGRDYRLVTMAATGGDLSADLMTSGTFQGGPQKYPLIGPIAWMPTGDRLIVARLDEGFTPSPSSTTVPEWLWEVPLTGDPPRKIGQVRLPKGPGLYLGVGSFSVHPTGRQLAFQRHEGYVSQTWALDNLLQFIKAGGGL
jgi:hypothetical protein